MSIIVAILALGFLIFFHELGHFLMAKACGVGVLEFSVGMGPRLISRVFRNTRYSLKLLPFGGSCAMLGEDSAGSGDFSTADGEIMEEEREEKDPWIDFDGVRYRESELSRRSFQNRPGWQRFLICFGGVFHNLLLAFLLALFVVHFSGMDRPVINAAQPGSSAESAGFERGDLLSGISLDGKRFRRIETFRELYLWLYLHSDSIKENSVLELRCQRNGQEERMKFSPWYDKESGKYRLGLEFSGKRVRPETVGDSLLYAYQELRYNVVVVFDSLQLLFRGRIRRNELMGPVGTVTVIGDTVEQSTRYGLFNAFLVLLNLCIMLSANLAVMNLLPIPALDGGRLLFILLEMISRKRLNPKVEETINRIGMIVLLLLMALIFLNDIVNLFNGAYRNIG